MAWNSEMGRPNCLRFLEYLSAASIGALRHADGERGDGDAAAIENAQAIDEAFAGLAEQLRFGQAAIGEDDFAGGAGAHAQLVFLLAGAKAGRALLPG